MRRGFAWPNAASGAASTAAPSTSSRLRACIGPPGLPAASLTLQYRAVMPKSLPKSIDETQALLARGDYVAERSLATSLYLSLAMQRPLFLEGEAGVGKTEIAKVIATLRAKQPPVVVITSNRTREIHDAVKRRCFYHWVDYPDAAHELEILRRKAPKAGAALSREVVAFVQRLRKTDLYKLPGVAETIDWANCLTALDRVALDPETVNNTLGVLLKYRDDLERVAGEEAVRLVGEAKAAAAG